MAGDSQPVATDTTTSLWWVTLKQWRLTIPKQLCIRKCMTRSCDLSVHIGCNLFCCHKHCMNPMSRDMDNSSMRQYIAYKRHKTSPMNLNCTFHWYKCKSYWTSTCGQRTGTWPACTWTSACRFMHGSQNLCKQCSTRDISDDGFSSRHIGQCSKVGACLHHGQYKHLHDYNDELEYWKWDNWHTIHRHKGQKARVESILLAASWGDCSYWMSCQVGNDGIICQCINRRSSISRHILELEAVEIPDALHDLAPEVQ